MGLLDKMLLLEKFQRMGWTVPDSEYFFVAPPASFWDSMKGRQFHVYHALEIYRMLTDEEGPDGVANDQS